MPGRPTRRHDAPALLSPRLGAIDLAPLLPPDAPAHPAAVPVLLSVRIDLAHLPAGLAHGILACAYPAWIIHGAKPLQFTTDLALVSRGYAHTNLLYDPAAVHFINRTPAPGQASSRSAQAALFICSPWTSTHAGRKVSHADSLAVAIPTRVILPAIKLMREHDTKRATPNHALAHYSDRIVAAVMGEPGYVRDSIRGGIKDFSARASRGVLHGVTKWNSPCYTRGCNTMQRLAARRAVRPTLDAAECPASIPDVPARLMPCLRAWWPWRPGGPLDTPEQPGHASRVWCRRWREAGEPTDADGLARVCARMRDPEQ